MSNMIKVMFLKMKFLQLFLGAIVCSCSVSWHAEYRGIINLISQT